MYLKKKITTHYLDDQDKRVAKGTPGARKVQVESKKWYICWRENGKDFAVPAYKDKRSSETKMAKLELAHERGQEGLIDPYKEHRNRKAVEHLEEFLPVFRNQVTNDVYYEETERKLRHFLTTENIATLANLNADAVETYLLKLRKKAPNTQKKYYTAISRFVKWLHKRRRIEQNFMVLVDVPRGGTKKNFRPLSREELQRLLDAARTRPVHDARLIRRGKRKGELAANVRPEVIQQLEQEGRERGLAYKTAMFTALRKEELERLKVGHLNLTHKPYPLIELQAASTKGKRGDKLLLVPSLAEELKCWIQDSGKSDGDLLFNVPTKKVVKLDLKFANIDLKTEKGHASFRSLRKTANMLLAEAGIPLKVRQLFMRHTDIRLTADTYDDSVLTDMTDIVPALEGIGLK